MNGWEDAFARALHDIDASECRRHQGGATASCTSAKRKTLLDFGSNDYLGLRDSLTALRAIQSVLVEHGWGSGASPVLSGYTVWHRELEQHLAAHCHTEAALVFSSGFAANMGTLACLAEAGDVVYSDALNHASLIDGIRLSRAERCVYPHNDLAYLEAHLAHNRSRFRRALIVTESVFSMDGDAASLDELFRVAQRWECGLVVDEAHATGVYGATGGGLLEELGLVEHPALILKLGTLSKALGSMGGFAAGSRTAIDFLINRCRTYLFSTAPPAAAMAATIATLQQLRSMESERNRLRRMAQGLRERLRVDGWLVVAGDSPIIAVLIGDAAEVIALSRHLGERGLDVPAIRPPTVPPDTSRLRISLSCLHQPDQLERLLSGLRSFPRRSAAALHSTWK